MAFLFRWLMRAFLAAAVLATAALGLAYYLASRSLPDYDRTVVLSGPEQEIEIVRDRYAVPHILSTTDHDAFFGLGYVHAQDRLWQMMLFRRTAQGRLSEIFGPDTVGIDTLMRQLDLYGLSREAVRVQTDATTAALEAYADGVNARLRVVQSEALGRGAPEFFLFTQEIAPWVPANSIAVQKLLALQMTDKAAMETLRASLSLRLPPERLRDLLPNSPNAPLMGLPEFSRLFPDGPPAVKEAAARNPLDPLAAPGLAGASNAFAAMGRRAAAGQPLLASDPHLALTAPSYWMLARMDLAEGPVIGGTIPGIPAVLVGRNADLGWGLTASYLDDQDVYVERLDPDDPGRYLTPTGYRPFATRPATIAVKGADPVAVTLRWTRHGPVIPGDNFGADAITPPGHVAALAWTALTAEDRSIGRGHRADARPFDRGGPPGGAGPRRAVAEPDPRRPPLGRPPDDRRRPAPPARQHQPRPHPGARLARRQRLAGHAGLRGEPLRRRSADRHRRQHQQQDHRRRLPRPPLLRLGRHLPHHPRRPPARRPPVPLARQLRRDPDRRRRRGRPRPPAARRPRPVVFGRARRRRHRRAPPPGGARAAGELERRDVRAYRRAADLRRLGPRPRSTGWSRTSSARSPPSSPAPSRCSSSASTATSTAPPPGATSTRRRRSRPAPTWPASPSTTPSSSSPRPTAPASRAGAGATRTRPSTATRPSATCPSCARSPTSARAPRAATTPSSAARPPRVGPEPYLNVHAAGYRGVYDFSDPDSSLYVISTGESGHILSRHYDDLAAIWRRGEYIPMSLDPDFARAGAVGITRLEPAATAGAAAAASIAAR